MSPETMVHQCPLKDLAILYATRVDLRNRSYLTNFEEIDGVFIAFGDALQNHMNYKPVVTGNQSNGNAGTKACDDADDDEDGIIHAAFLWDGHVYGNYLELSRSGVLDSPLSSTLPQLSKSDRSMLSSRRLLEMVFLRLSESYGASLIAFDNPYTSNLSSLSELFLSFSKSSLVVLNSLMNAPISSCSRLPSSINLYNISSIVSFLGGQENWKGWNPNDVPDIKDMIQSKAILGNFAKIMTFNVNTPYIFAKYAYTQELSK
ncbi:hypothetical protein Tco_0231513 [Tanacetum coccineum]